MFINLKPSHSLLVFLYSVVFEFKCGHISPIQGVDGLSLTLDQTLGSSNPHYSRVLREKMAAREAANKAMEARRDALVEASWCRILRAAR